VELTPIDATEVARDELNTLWIRGGFPDSFTAPSDRASLRWRQSFVRTYLERDIPLLGPRIPAETLRRFWIMLAHQQGGLLNAAALARGLGVDGKTVASYLDLLVDLLLVRRLEPWHANVGKRMVKSPRIYVRDSGLVHSLLGLQTQEDVLGHPVVGGSWEGFVLETLIAAAPEGTRANFYRTSGGAEADLVLELPGGDRWITEVKRSLTPKPERGFHHAGADLDPVRRFVVYPGTESFTINADVEAIPVQELGRRLLELGGSTSPRTRARTPR
jgi:hypothetical protein